MFAETTKDVLESSEFLAAGPKIVNAIFQQENAAVDSEMDFVRALERYVEHHEESDPQIVEKVRPALKNIRFLALAPADFAKTKLLKSTEIRVFRYRFDTNA